MVFQASMALCRSIRRRVWGTRGLGGLELHHLLLLREHQRAFSTGLFWWFVGGAVMGQGVGRGQTEDSSAKHLLPRRCPGFMMANSLIER